MPYTGISVAILEQCSLYAYNHAGPVEGLIYFPVKGSFAGGFENAI